MRDVSIIGIGQVPVGEHWNKSLRLLGAEAVLASLADARVERPEALYAGNMLCGQLSNQQNLAALVADYAGLRGIEAIRTEAACASGAAAVRMGWMAVASGLMDVVVALGVEKMTDAPGGRTTTALAAAADAVYEGEHGISFVALNGLLMRRYMHEYGYEHDDFAGFSVNAHANAVHNPNAMFRKAISPEAYRRAKMISDPVSLLDSSGIADGAAAVVLAPTAHAQERGLPAVRVLASSVGTDSVAIHDRHETLFLSAAEISVQRALAQSGLRLTDMDFFELHDAFTIIATLSLEAAGFAPRGQGVRMAMEGAIALDGSLPISTMGGLKARGHPVGASGVYQIVEAVQQLRGEAGQSQLPHCRVGMTQSIGGSGATIVTHILGS
ncbi:MAG: thiolase domain-containing protein [Chloroflexi bacterium]|nr:thiolase domain-containing protein [Chloroflexota bacterium]